MDYRYEWLRSRPRSLRLERAPWRDDPATFAECSAEALAVMEALNTVWSLQMEQGGQSLTWFGPTADSVIESAMDYFSPADAAPSAGTNGASRPEYPPSLPQRNTTFRK